MKVFGWNSIHIGLVKVVTDTVQLDEARDQYIFDVANHGSK